MLVDAELLELDFAVLLLLLDEAAVCCLITCLAAGVEVSTCEAVTSTVVPDISVIFPLISVVKASKSLLLSSLFKLIFVAL